MYFRIFENSTYKELKMEEMGKNEWYGHIS